MRFSRLTRSKGCAEMAAEPIHPRKSMKRNVNKTTGSLPGRHRPGFWAAGLVCFLGLAVLGTACKREVETDGELAELLAEARTNAFVGPSFEPGKDGGGTLTLYRMNGVQSVCRCEKIEIAPEALTPETRRLLQSFVAAENPANEP